MELLTAFRCLVVFMVLFSCCEFTQHDNEYNLSSLGKPSPHNKQQVSRSIPTKFSHKNKKKAYDLDNSPGLFSAITSIIGGSATDTFTAYRNITRLIQNAFPPRRANGNSTTTTFTIGQALQLFGRNYRGLRRLFDKEFVRALNDSDKNVMEFGRELKNSIRPFFDPNRNLTTNTG